VIDLGSTHGTFVNKMRIEKDQQQTLSDGDVLILGQSTRMYVVNIVEECSSDEEPETVV
jgi:pSer/pThr/pTyr-binding forkhead associated (FHA) protein